MLNKEATVFPWWFEGVCIVSTFVTLTLQQLN